METPSTFTGTVSTRRNPPRKARPPGSTKPQPCISSFPIDDLLDVQLQEQNQHEQIQEIVPPPDGTSESLKVYLRIRPSNDSGSRVQKSRQKQLKNVWPRNLNNRIVTRRKKSAEECKENYISVNDCLDSVTLLPPVTLQDSKRMKAEVFEGFSRIFAYDASQEEVYQNMVGPLVEEFLLGKSAMLAALGPSGSGKTYTVFGTPRDPGMVPLALRHIFKQVNEGRFYLSIFEIYSEQGKVEKICDLSPEGSEVSMHQSTVKGLQQVPVSDASHAETLISCALMKRATAMTNTNDQSSRSQCVISIGHCAEKDEVGHDGHHRDAVLTIIDLAGAEREKKTGNQGSRLQESNFINKTVMVFGQCLRSLLEHQRNPRKPLQKHFQNSLLTKYLRDYLEGKKRMTLILTVKPGRDSYLGTAYLLRQASPYMRIKFDRIEEPVKIAKRPLQTFTELGQIKRTKHSCLDNCTMNLNSQRVYTSDETRITLAETPRKPECVVDLPQVEQKCSDSPNFRAQNIMQSFSKVIWNVLKEYNKKLKNAEQEIKRLKEVSVLEKKLFSELEKELTDFKIKCRCSKSTPGEFYRQVKECLDAPDFNEQDELQTIGKILHPQNAENFHLCASRTTLQQNTCQNDANSKNSKSQRSSTVFDSCSQAHSKLISSTVFEEPENAKKSHLSTSETILHQDTCENEASLKNCLFDSCAQEKSQMPENSIAAQQDGGQESDKPMKPRRRLLPASSNLLRNTTALEIDDERDIKNANKGGKRIASSARQRTPGNESLMHLLQKNFLLD